MNNYGWKIFLTMTNQEQSSAVRSRRFHIHNIQIYLEHLW